MIFPYANIIQVNMKKALNKSLPIALGYVPLGIISGMLLKQGGLSVFEVFLISILVFAGSAQFVAAGLFMQGISPISIILTTFIINLRQLMYSSSLSQYITEKSPIKIMGLSHFITDETFAVNIANYEDGDWSDAQATLLGFFSCMFWLSGNVVGAIFGKQLPIPTDVSAFALTAMFLILLIFQFKLRRDVIIWVIGTIVAITVYIIYPSSLSIIISTLITVGIAIVLENAGLIEGDANDN